MIYLVAGKLDLPTRCQRETIILSKIEIITHKKYEKLINTVDGYNNKTANLYRNLYY